MDNRWAKIYLNQGILAVSLFEQVSKGLIKEMAYRPVSSFVIHEELIIWIDYWIYNGKLLDNF